uniref:Immunoglobulin domain-containing protein n=1 Tax=Pelusios castaneus TaxID=367368 RepID=A0A8C8SEB3_9SAUR
PLTYGRSYVHPPFILDFFFFFAGCWALTGPHEAKGPLGGELSVQCSYVRGYETYIKYWCRGTMQISCHVVVQTSDSEAIVKQDRVSIRDIRTNNTFIVTMKNLTEGDSGIYWCGIEELGWDRMFSVKVSVLPGKFLHDSGWIFIGLCKCINRLQNILQNQRTVNTVKLLLDSCVCLTNASTRKRAKS